MNDTKIDWCDATLNPVVGCTYGCPFCYARRMNQRFGWVEDFSKPQFFPERLKQLKSKTPKVIFMDSMSDIADWKDPWTRQIFAACEDNPQHKYLFLTKRPNKLCSLANSKMLPEDNSFWWGTTVMTSRDTYFGGGIRHNVFLSIEPLLEPLDAGVGSFGRVKWIIVGAETGKRKGKVVPKREWVENIVEAASITHIPVFMKSSLRDIWGEPLIQEFPWEM